MWPGMSALKKHWNRHVSPYWKTWVVVLTPLLLLPLPLAVDGMESRAAYGIILMTVYWLTAALPLAVTSLLPIVVFPLMDVLGTSQVCSLYFKEANVVFFGGVLLAMGVERSNLHQRIAFRVILIAGANPQWLMLGFMMVGMFLSFWISNSGVTAMLIPIVEAVVQELFQDSKADEVECQGAVSLPVVEVEFKSPDSSNGETDRQRIKTAMLLSISYSASIGGAGTLIGSGAPLAFKGILEQLYGTDTGMTFATWMAVGVPCALINILVSWAVLRIMFMGFWKRGGNAVRGLRDSKEVKSSIRKQFNELGPATFYEKSVMALFITLILLWLFKDPQFMPGWEDLFPKEHRIGDATVVIAIAVLAFALPSKPNFWCFVPAEGGEPSSSKSLLEWGYVQKKFPWSVLLLLGGGYAISDASKVSGLSHWLGLKLAVMVTFPPFAIMLLLSLLASTITEVASNTATASILLPIVAKMAEAMNMNPLYVMIPVTISCCYAFMLPVGTPCNAMVFTAGKMKSRDMVLPGFFINILTMLVTCATTELIGSEVFELHNNPDWADGIIGNKISAVVSTAA